MLMYGAMPAKMFHGCLLALVVPLLLGSVPGKSHGTNPTSNRIRFDSEIRTQPLA